MLNENERKVAIAIFGFSIIVLSSIILLSMSESNKFYPQGKVIAVSDEMEIEYKGVQNED